MSKNQIADKCWKCRYFIQKKCDCLEKDIDKKCLIDKIKQIKSLNRGGRHTRVQGRTLYKFVKTFTPLYGNNLGITVYQQRTNKQKEIYRGPVWGVINKLDEALLDAEILEVTSEGCILIGPTPKKKREPSS